MPRFFLRPVASLTAACALAALIGLVAWNDRDRLWSSAALLLLPLLIQRPASRWGGFAVAAAYYACITRAVPDIVRGFFVDLHPVAIAALWFTHAALLAAIWAVLGPRPGMNAVTRALATAAALAMLTVPPLGLFHWGSPLLVAGLLFPGWHGLGLALTLLGFALMAACRRRARTIQAALGGLAVAAIGANLASATPALPVGWTGESTAFGSGAASTPAQLRQREQWLSGRAMQALAQGYKLIVFPESISGLRERTYPEIWAPVAARARAAGATVIVGREYRSVPHADFKNAFIGYGHYGGDGAVLASSQVPMPIGDWKFGLAGGAETDLFGSDLRYWYGEVVSFSVCYEDFLLWPHRGLLHGRATVLVSAANQWPSAGTSAEQGQDISRSLLARVAGVPIIIAKNT